MIESRYSDGRLAKWYYSQTNVISDGDNEYYLASKESIRNVDYSMLLGTNDLLDELNKLSDENEQLKSENLALRKYLKENYIFGCIGMNGDYMTDKRFTINNDMNLDSKVETYELSCLVDNDNKTFYFVVDSIANVESFVERLNELNEENQDLKAFNQDLSENLSVCADKRLAQGEYLTKLTNENEKLKQNCKNYEWYKQYKNLLNENEQLKNELFETSKELLWATSDEVDRVLYYEDEVEELRKEIFE